ncbi:PRC-barrel domain containing protein [Halorussus ruber]|uniref:PRC-barrel domain containing protein n=1 Tax=Halorussus ruber TaxID=1126238 RepID=UPI001092C978|nr:PRC-barrel domain containing protein [Halorussus ruber]
MTDPLTESDEGKRVVSADGELLGEVAKVDQGVAHLEPEEDYDAIKSYLDWESDEDEGYTFQETAVEEVTDEKVVLKAGGEA